MAILWTGLGNWSIWKINWQKKCSWFNVRMFVLAQGTGRWWDFLSAAMQIYASLKCLPNYSLGLTLREWLSQNLPVKIWTWFKKSLLAVHFFFSFLTFLFFVLPRSVWDSILAIRSAFFCPPRIFLVTVWYRSFAGLPTVWSYLTCTGKKVFSPDENWFFFFFSPHLCPPPKIFLVSLLQGRAGLTSSAMNTVLQLATVCCWLLLVRKVPAWPHPLVQGPALILLQGLYLKWAISVLFLFLLSCFLAVPWCIRIALWNSGLVCGLLFPSHFWLRNCS